MPNATAGLASANPATSQVSRRPQTTGGSDPSVPFTRNSRKAEIQAYATSGTAFGALITQPLKAAGGYLRGLWITITATGGAGGSATAAADAPFSVITSCLLRDSMGQPIVQVDGYGLAAIMRHSGQFAMAGFQEPTTLPSYSAINGTTGNFTVRLYLPLELDSSAYCALPILNASAVPTLTLQLAASTAVYATPPVTTIPTLAVVVNEAYWAAPTGIPDMGPPDVGSSAQWSMANASAGPPSNGSARLVMPRVGTYLHTIIAIARDSTGARADLFPVDDLGFSVDGVPIFIRSKSEHYDEQYTKFGLAKTTGVLALSFRDAVQQLVGEADTHDLLLSTTPATLLELTGIWATNANLPAQVTFYSGELYPVAGIPYNHLAS